MFPKDILLYTFSTDCGILANYPDFQHRDIKDVVYDFSCPQYQELDDMDDGISELFSREFIQVNRFYGLDNSVSANIKKLLK